MKLKDFDFRVWNCNTNKYIESSGHLALAQDSRVLSSEDNCSGQDYAIYHRLENSNMEIELFTGLYDKNGRKIYEGDIVCCLTSQGKPLYYFITSHENINTFQIFVISDLEEFKVCNEIDINNFLYCDLSNLEDMKFNSEVVGNIHEKKECKEVK